MARTIDPTKKARVENLASGYPVKTDKGTRIARPSGGEDERYRKNLGQQPRGITSKQGNEMEKKRRFYNKSTY